MTGEGIGLWPCIKKGHKVKMIKCKHCGGEFNASQFKRWHGINCLKAFSNGKNLSD